jgi:L-threonylcarbamoyladenylate synthase
MGHSSSAQIDGCIEALKQGQLVALPTETVYGLAADASNEVAIQQVFRLKGRPLDNPLIVHLPDQSQMVHWAAEIPTYARVWAKRFWPGPLTMVFKKQDGVSDLITAGQDTVALRVPNHPLTLRLLQTWGGAFVAPSANRYGHISPTKAQDVRDEFGNQAPLILDGGPCDVGIESTIVSCFDEHPTILRPGMISASELSEAAQRPVDLAGLISDVVTPGQSEAHYAPQTKTVMLVRSEMNHHYFDVRAGFFGFAPPPFEAAAQVILPRDPERAARLLYGSLRTLDRADLDLIVIEATPVTASWVAIGDRLKRASSS